MGVLQPAIDASLRIWRENSPAARFALVLLTCISCAAIIGVGYWSIQPNYVALANDLDSSKVDAVVDALDKAGIRYQLSGAGGNLMVDKRDFARARLIVRNEGAEVATNASTSGLGNVLRSHSERLDQARLQKEQHLAASVMKLESVDHADVHLNTPENGPFEREQSPATASVLLTLRPGYRLSQEQASSIATFVAYAVDNLLPQNVQITDKEGRSYGIPDETTHQIQNQVQYATDAEMKLARKAEAQLIHFLGFGNASVQVHLDLTFSNGSRTSTKYDAEGAVPNEEDVVSETTTSAESKQGGQATVTNAQASDGSTQVQSKTENVKTSYLVPTTEETEVNTTPMVNFLSVSVLINSDASGVKQEDGTLPPNLSQQITSMVKNAVGFQDERDTISVEFLPFPSIDAPSNVPASFSWESWSTVLENALLAMAALFALIVSLLFLRRFRPEPTREISGLDLAAERERRSNLNRVADLLEKNPDVFLEVARAWAKGSEDRDEERRAA